MTDTLQLVCAKPNKRPRQITDAMARLAAEAVAVDLIKSGSFAGETVAELADDIMQATKRNRSMDGYELAKELDDRCGWSPDAAMVEALDGFSSVCDAELRKAERVWADENPMEPPLPIGTVIKTHRGPGKISCVYEHAPHSYLVTVEGVSVFPIIRFEDAVPA